MEEQQLIKQAKRGNQKAGHQLYQVHERHWFRICLRYAQDQSEAKDIFQEGVIAVFNHLGQFDAKRGQFRSWSNRIMVNAALRYLKQQQWQQSFADLEVAVATADEGEDGLDHIALQELIAMIQQLPTSYRVVFNLYVMEGYSHQEIAEQLQVPVATSKSRLSKARKALRQRLETTLLK